MQLHRRMSWAIAACATVGVIVVVFGGGLRARAEAVDEPQSLAALAPAAIPDDENAAAQLEKITGQIDRWSADYVALCQSPLGMAFVETTERGEPPTPEQAAAVQKVMNGYADLDAALGRAAACESFASRGDFTKTTQQFLDDLLLRIQRFRNIGRYYDWRIRMLSFEGQPEAAIRRGVEMLKLARLSEDEPTMMSYLVAAAVRHVTIRAVYDALAAGRVSFDAHTSLDAELARIDDSRAFTRMLRSERAFDKTAEQAGPLGIANFFGAAPGTGASDYMTKVIEASELPWREFYAQVRDGGALAAPTGFGVMADNLTPALKACATARARNLAMIRSLRVVNALRLFSKLHQREATGLEELGLPADASADPFVDGPLKLKLSERGWAVYSVGENGVDDGGSVSDLKDFGVGPAAATGG